MTAGSHVEGIGAIVLACRGRGGKAAVGAPAAEVQEVVHAAVDAGLWPVVVVVGASTELLRGALAGLPVVTCTGTEGGAVRLGLARLAECAPGARAMVLLRCDHPAAGARHLAALAAAAERERKPIAASTRGGALGAPALFDAALFAELEHAADERALLADPARVAAVELH